MNPDPLKSTARTRRGFLQASFASLALCPLASRAFASEADGVVATAKAGLARAGGRIQHRDVVGVADFTKPSSIPRFHLIDLAAGKVETLLVAHGRGSDPEHTGWLQSFSNLSGSAATSQGDYVTGEYYVGEHGRSMRLHGLDSTNCNAEERGIVVHSAWYVGPSVVIEHGRLGRSEGCFAVSPSDLSKVLARLGPGRLLVATKL
ncbi:murein L,D-transpeptidase catalytic domain family protein [Caulobacter sp. S45]|uniref:murein L,D-transpeptidase catalytic domain family protein n=1 Tax=Caulobacter sp. S45 TaxID=1641861 RepID=UPI001576A46B|nr:murein L,D-transpeptidase catalytic domain family protein [Caulobacter sp. S45]